GDCAAAFASPSCSASGACTRLRFCPTKRTVTVGRNRGKTCRGDVPVRAAPSNQPIGYAARISGRDVTAHRSTCAGAHICPIVHCDRRERPAAQRCRARAAHVTLRTVIHEIDESLRRLVLRDAVNGSGVELSFDAPTKEWASRRNTPAINIYLYDIREDLARREVEYEEIRDADGRVTERRPPPRRYTLSYLVTVWTQRPEDEHQVLSSLAARFLQFDRLPQDVLSETLAAQPYAVRTTVALPPPRDRTLAD